MKKIFTLLLLFFVLFFCIHSYAQTWDWGRGSTGGLLDAWPVATDPSGNVFIAGWADNGEVFLGSDTIPDAECVIAKYDPYGTFLWAVSTNGNSFPINIATDQSGNSYLFGSLNDYSMTIDTFTLTNATYPNIQYFLVKLDPSGSVLWATTAGGSAGGMVSTYAGGGIATDTAGNVYITCNFSDSAVYVDTFTLINTDPSGLTDDILLAKYDSSGNVKWAKSYGGSNSDDAYALTVTPWGNIYIGGVFQSPSVVFGPSTISMGTSFGNAFIARFDNLGAPTWASGSGGTSGDFAAGIATDTHGNVYMTGGFWDSAISFAGTTITNPNDGIAALYLIKFDSANHVSWDKTIYNNSAGNHAVWGYTIAMSACNNVWVGGNFGDDYLADDTNEVNIDGHTLLAPPGGGDPVFIAGYSVEGVYAGSVALSSGSDDQLGIACDQGGNIFICADYISDTTLVIGTADTLSADSTGGFLEWLYVAKYDPPFTLVAISDTTFQNIDTTICSGSIELNGPADYFSYLWSNDSTTQDISVDTAGNYWLIAGKACAAIITIDTFKVTYKSTISDTIIKTTDTAICKGALVKLAASPGYTRYLWNTGSTGSIINTDSTGTYWVAAFIPCTIKIDIDTFVVTYAPSDTISMSQDTVICKGGQILLSGPNDYSSYLWSNASTGITMTADSAGTYWLIAVTSCAAKVNIDTFIVKPLDLTFSLGNDTVACSPFIISVPLAGVSYFWQDGSTDSTYTISGPGTYYATTREDGCAYADTIHVRAIDVTQLLRDTTFCRETFSQYTLAANVPEGASVLWSTGSMEPSIVIADTGIYWVVVSDSSCVGKDTMTLSTTLCNCVAFLPTAFTPNNDGRNDFFHPFFEDGCIVESFYFSVYNRWGQQVFFTENPYDKWDGNFMGIKAELGTYMYLLRYNSGLYSTPHEAKGDITLIR